MPSSEAREHLTDADERGRYLATCHHHADGADDEYDAEDDARRELFTEDGDAEEDRRDRL